MWVPMVGFDGYLIDEDGKVQNMATGRILPWHKSDKTGSRSVTKREIYVVRPWGHYAPKPVHHAVLEAFVSPRPPGMVASFKDGNTLNPVLDNVLWKSRKGVVRHNKLSYTDVVLLRYKYEITYDVLGRLAASCFINEFAKSYGCSSCAVRKAATRKTYKNIP